MTTDTSTAKAKPRWRTWVFFALKGLLSVGLLASVVWKVRPTLPAVSELDFPSIALATALLLLQPPLIAFRWGLLIAAFGGNARYPPLLQATWVSVLAGQFLPASVGGDVIRAFYAHARGEALRIAASSVIVDRAIALVAIAILAALFCPLLFGLRDPAIVVLTIVVAVGGIVSVPVLSWLAGPVERRSEQWRWLKPLAVVLSFARLLLARRDLALGALAIALCVHAASAAALYLISRGIGIAIDPLHLVAVSVVITFAMGMPISIGGWGVREAVAVTLMGSLGASTDQAFLAAVLLGACYAAASLPGAFLWFGLGRRPTETTI